MSLLSLLFLSYVGHVRRMCVFTALQCCLVVLTGFFRYKKLSLYKSCNVKGILLSVYAYDLYSVLQTVSSTFYWANIILMVVDMIGWDIVVGTATCYWLDGLGIKSQEGARF